MTTATKTVDVVASAPVATAGPAVSHVLNVAIMEAVVLAAEQQNTTVDAAALAAEIEKEVVARVTKVVKQSVVDSKYSNLPNIVMVRGCEACGRNYSHGKILDVELCYGFETYLSKRFPQITKSGANVGQVWAAILKAGRRHDAYEKARLIVKKLPKEVQEEMASLFPKDFSKNSSRY